MLHVTALPEPDAPIEHVSGAAALPRIAEVLVNFEPSVLLSDDGRGAVYAPDGDQGAAGDRLWLLADAATALAWQAAARDMSLTFQSRDDRVFLAVSGVGEVLTLADSVRPLWRPSFGRWFSGPDDPRLHVVRFTASYAEFYHAPDGRVTRHVTL
jgi:general stress protein 26